MFVEWAGKLISKRVSMQLIIDAMLVVEVAIVTLTATLAELLYPLLPLAESQLREEQYFIVGLSGGVLSLLIMRNQKLTNYAAIAKGGKIWRELLISLVMGVMLVIAAGFALKISSNYSRAWLILWLCLSAVGVVTWRHAMGRLLKWVATNGLVARRVVVVGARSTVQPLVKGLVENPRLRIVALTEVDPDLQFSAAPKDLSAGEPLLDLVSACQRGEYDEIMIEPKGLSDEQIRFLLAELSILPVDIWLNSSHSAAVFDIQGVERIEHFNMLKIRSRAIQGWGFMAKQALDYFLALLLFAAAAPLMVLIAAAIKLESKGPAIFRQRRVGYNGKLITVYKFRTMTTTEDGQEVKQASRKDPRITRVGAFLRRTSLDELPQLVNILKGEMSFVGPRPHALAHHEHYRRRVHRYDARHRVKPGITGLAQVTGLRGETDTPEKMQRRVEADLEYIDNWSIWLDLKIIFMTPLFGMMGRNAR